MTDQHVLVYVEYRIGHTIIIAWYARILISKSETTLLHDSIFQRPLRKTTGLSLGIEQEHDYSLI